MATSDTTSVIKAPALQIETTELDLSPSITSPLSDNQSPTYSDRSTSPTKLPLSNPRFSRQLSVRSCNSVRAIGTIPIGQLIVSPEQQELERPTQKLDQITEERRLQVSQPQSKCLENGDIFRLLELPSNFIVGHDEIAFLTTKPGDDGLRDITPGPHFLWVQQLSTQQEGGEPPTHQLDTQQHGPAPRCGYWYVTRPAGQIRVKQWDKYNEILGDVASHCEADEVKANIQSIYPTLRKYQVADPGQSSSRSGRAFATPQASLWNQLTWAISEPFLERVTGRRNVHEWLVDSSDCVKGETHLSLYPSTASRAYKAAVSSELTFLFSEDFADLDLLDSHINTQNSSNSADTSGRVIALLNNPAEGVTERDIIAELQFTYVTGTQLGNAACLEQWWELVLKIVLRSWQLIRYRPELCRDLLRTLHAQLIHTAGYVENHEENDREMTEGLSSEKPIFSTHVKNKRKLRRALVVYKRRLDELLLESTENEVSLEQQEVGKVFEDLEAWLWKYQWDLRNEVLEDEGQGGDGRGSDDDHDEDDDDDDLLPVVVDLDENGRERGLVSFS